MREFYLKTIVLILKNKKDFSRFGGLVKKMAEQGISVQVYRADDGYPMLSKDVLYITDSHEQAKALQKADLPILGFSHEQGDGLPGIRYLMEEPEELDAEYPELVYRRYRDIPWDILETDRCRLRESTVEDVEEFWDIYADPDITKYTEALFPDIEQEKAYIREYIDKVYHYYEFGVWTVLSKETGEIIGRAGFSVRDGEELPELGFVIGSKCQRKGIAYEICKAILDYGWEMYEFDAVQAFVMPQNQASLKLCSKLGFVQKERMWEKTTEYIKLTIEKPVS